MSIPSKSVSKHDDINIYLKRMKIFSDNRTLAQRASVEWEQNDRESVKLIKGKRLAISFAECEFARFMVQRLVQ